jgi:Phage-related protein
MGVRSFLETFFTLQVSESIGVPEPVRARSGDSIDDLVQRLGYYPKPWTPQGVNSALGVPAIHRAVSLIATTIGALSMNAYRNGVLLDPEDRPAVMVRPDPFRKPRTFYRDTGWNMATRGEAIWWVAKRDADDKAVSLINVPPQEVLIEPNPDDPRYPHVTWRNLTTIRPTPANMRAARVDDFRHLTLVQLAGDLRGTGPLQMCGAAVSVAVEAQDFAANFYADGGYPSTVIKAAGSLSPTPDADGNTEADILRAEWVNRPNNMPRVIDQAIESVEDHVPSPVGAQLLQARDFQTGEAARMFGIPGSLLDYSTPGSSLTYQNLEGEFTKWVRAGLWPYYLEEIEQEMSDLLTRSTVARFNIDALERADLKTRFEVYKLGIDAGVYTAELAQAKEGIVPGDVENAPIPFAVPAAVPDTVPVARSEPVRCDGTRVLRGIMRPCNKLLAESEPFIGRCERCGKVYAAA